MNTCGYCKWFLRRDIKEGECHGTAPTVFMVAQQSKLGTVQRGFMTTFPSVGSETIACRHFMMKLAEATP